MNTPPSKKADKFLQETSLQSLFLKIKELAELNQHILPYLDPHIRSYCQVANLVDHRLILLVANSSIATQLRFETIHLLQQFKKHPRLKRIREIHCKVRPFSMQPPQTNKEWAQVDRLSKETAHIVYDTAQLIKDSRLKEIMARIATRIKK